MNQSNQQAISSCVRCGTCCSTGGPAFHDEDIGLVENGLIPLTSLYTIRKGELARDNIRGGLICVDAEIIKIKSKPDSPSCLYYDDAQTACRIYDNRPLECRKQECWDESGIVSVYLTHRMTRGKVLSSIQWISELVASHETKCSFAEIKRFVELREKGDARGAGGLQEIINYDDQFRRLLVEKGNIGEDMLEFLFGRPLANTVNKQYGIKIEKNKT